MVATRDELTEIARLAIERDLLVVTDEVYEHIVFDGEHIPISTLPGMRERTVTIGSAGKTFSFTGWKIGWVTATPELVTAVRTAKQFLTFVSGGPFQYAIATGLALPDSFYADLSAGLKAKRDLLAAGLAAAGFEVFAPHGTYFITTEHRRAQSGRRARFLPPPAAHLRRRGGPQRSLLRRQAGRSQPGPVRVLQAE